jgi:hypothetical protein
VVGFIEIDAGLHPLATRGALVTHELAHAYEVSCLSQIRTTEELLQTLRARATSGDPSNSTETPFAAAVEKAVRDESFSGEQIASQLPAVVANDLDGCVSPVPKP